MKWKQEPAKEAKDYTLTFRVKLLDASIGPGLGSAMALQDSEGPLHASNARFLTTHWSQVMAAGGSDTTSAQAALEQLCRTYWRPLYAYVRRRGHSPADAADLTQSFFYRLLARESLAEVHPCKGRFRSFLLASMNHFLADEWDKARAQKRGADRLLAVDYASAEAHLGEVMVESQTPEQAFERQWALTLLEEVYLRLQREYEVQDKATLFAALKATLAGSRETQPYAELAEALDMTPGAVRVAVHRLRRRYRQLLKEVIADTVTSQTEVEDELRYLLQVLARG